MNIKSNLLTLALLTLCGSASASIVQFDATDNVYFEYINTNENWDKANSDAQSAVYNGMQGFLAVIANASENSFVSTLIPNNSSSSAWLGASNTVIGNQEDWTWTNGVKFNCTIGNGASCTSNVYTNFSAGEPNNYAGNENALQMYSNGTWNDLNKNNQSFDNPGYIVEFAKSATQTVPEPASIVLLLAGMFGVATSGRKQRLTLAASC